MIHEYLRTIPVYSRMEDTLEKILFTSIDKLTELDRMRLVHYDPNDSAEQLLLQALNSLRSARYTLYSTG